MRSWIGSFAVCSWQESRCSRELMEEKLSSYCTTAAARQLKKGAVDSMKKNMAEQVARKVAV